MKSEMFHITREDFPDPSLGSTSGRLKVVADLYQRESIPVARVVKYELSQVFEKLIQVYEEVTHARVIEIQLRRAEDFQIGAEGPRIKLTVEL